MDVGSAYSGPRIRPRVFRCQVATSGDGRLQGAPGRDGVSSGTKAKSTVVVWSAVIRYQPMRFGRLILVRLFGVVNRGFARRSQRHDMLERWLWIGGTIFVNLGVIWEPVRLK